MNTTADQNDGSCPVDCSLREAVLVAMRTGDIVQVPAGTYTLSLGQLNVGQNVTIQGAGADATVIQAGTNERVMHVTSNATITGVRITGGDAPSTSNSGGGIEIGGNQVLLTLNLSASAITGNSVVDASQGYGGGMMVNQGATLLMTNTTISGNRVLGGDGPGVGGGIYVDGGGRAELRNSTVSGNVAQETFSSGVGGGIGADAASTVVMENVTVASNTAEIGGGIAQDNVNTLPPPTLTISDTIVAGNSGAECSGALVHGGDFNLSDGATCGFTATGDRQNVDPLLGPLQINTGIGRTATHALGPLSPAINAGDPTTCKATDQRGAVRSAFACDIGAFEYVLPTLRVVTTVVNDDGGALAPGGFSVHVRSGPSDVPGSPAPGSATGSVYTLPAGAYAVSADAVTRYVTSVAGDCASDGTVTLAENQGRTCTITADDQLPPPKLRKTVNVKPKSGTVRFKRPNGKKFVALTEGRQIPVDSTIDTRKGRVTLTAAADNKGNTATADFYEGLFKVGQTKGSKPFTTIKLTEKLTCAKAGKATTAAKKKRKRRIWGDGSGKFRTEGQYSSATVRGTIWLTQDHCDRTWTKVVAGRVSVRDFIRKKTIIVRAGKEYIARVKKR